MPRSDISESTELDIIDEMILLPTSGCGTFSLGPNGFDRLRAIFPLDNNDWEARNPAPRSGPSPLSGDLPPSLLLGVASPRLPGHYTVPRAQHNCHDNWTRNRSNIIGTPSRIPDHQPVQEAALAGAIPCTQLWDGPDELQNERILPRPSRWEQDRLDGDLSTAIKQLRFSEPPESRDVHTIPASVGLAVSPPSEDKILGEPSIRIRQLIEISIRACDHTATSEQIRAAADLIAVVCECDDSVNRMQQVLSSITPQPMTMVQAIIRNFPEDSTAAQKARASAMPQHTSPALVQTPNGKLPGDVPNSQSPTMSTRSNGDGSRVAVFQQVSDGSPFNLQPVESNSGGFPSSASVSTRGLSLVQDNPYETRTTLVSHNDQHGTFGVDVTKRGRKFTGRRPKTGGLQGMRWFSSSYHRSIIPKLGAQDNRRWRGTFIVWMYTGEMLGPGSWREITDKYFEDDGEIIHPMDSERVLSIQDESREPSFILRGTFMKKKQISYRTSSINQMCDFSSSGNWPDAPRNWECNHHVSMGPKWEVRPSGSGVPDAGPGFGTAASSSFVRHPDTPCSAPRFLPVVPSTSSVLSCGFLSRNREFGYLCIVTTTDGIGPRHFQGGSSSFPLTNELSTAFLPRRAPAVPLHKAQPPLSHNMVTNSHRPGVWQPSNPPPRVLFEEMDVCGRPHMRKPAQPVLLCSIPPPHYRLLSPSYGWLDPANA
ncbi:hypothetical protein BD779DRAFT_1473912 [Infundibulicybe gibba]|nr:hypothetical protein BD779DRAFT_1473912 [Infundibulicybe gibba]